MTHDVGGILTAGGVRTTYLALALRLQLAAEVGPVRAQLGAGPSLDQLLSHSLDPVFAQVLEVQHPMVLGVTVGGGVGVWVSGVFVGAEARLDEKLTSAFEGPVTKDRPRTVELVLRAGVPLARLRGG